MRMLRCGARMLAPVLPFLTEEMWGNLTSPQRRCESGDVPESVHLTDYPESRSDLLDEALNRRVEVTLQRAPEAK